MEMEVIKWKKFNEEQTVLKNGQSRSSGFTVQQILDSIKKNSIKETYDVVTSCGFNCTETDEVVVLCNYIQNDNVYLTQDILKSSIIERQKLYTKQIAPIAVNMNKPTSYDKAVGESKKFITDAIKQKNIPTVPVEVKDTKEETKERNSKTTITITGSSIRLKHKDFNGTKIIDKKQFLTCYRGKLGYDNIAQNYGLTTSQVSSIVRKLETEGELDRNFTKPGFSKKAKSLFKAPILRKSLCPSIEPDKRLQNFRALLSVWGLDDELYLRNYYKLSLQEQAQVFKVSQSVCRQINKYIADNAILPVTKTKMIADINAILEPYGTSKNEFVKIWNKYSDVNKCAEYFKMSGQLARTVADDLRLTC